MEDFYKNKYKYIFETSPGLFNFIFTQFNTDNFDKEQFLKNLNIMLSAIEDIQSSKITQHDASVNIGETLAAQFIPQCAVPPQNDE